MSSFNLRRFSRPQVLRTIARQFLLQLLDPHRAFFHARGVDLPPLHPPKRRGTGANGATVTDLPYEQLTKVLVSPGPDTPADLADALYFVHEMATEAGMDALLKEIGFERLRCSFLELAPADVAVRAWLTDRRAMERAHAQLSACVPRRFQYFQSHVGPVSPFSSPTTDQLVPLERKLGQVFADRNRGPSCRVFAFPHERDCLFYVRHGEPYRREAAIEGEVASSVLYRPMRFDVVIYDPLTATLRVNARTRWETSLYRNEFGRLLLGTIDAFPNFARYALAPLRDQGPKALACSDVPGLKLVTLVEVALQWPGRFKELEVRKARDVFAALKFRKASLEEKPRIVRAKFEVQFRGDHRTYPLLIIPPNVAQYARDEEGPLVDAWLTARGFLRDATSDKTKEAGGGPWAMVVGV